MSLTLSTKSDDDRPEILRFGTFLLDVHSGELRRSGQLIPLRQQAITILGLLARNSGRLVTREEIRTEVWGADTSVDFDQGLNDCVRGIRAALEDQAKDPRYIETLPRRGYRFVAPVEPVEGPVTPRLTPPPFTPAPDPAAKRLGASLRWRGPAFAALAAIALGLGLLLAGLPAALGDRVTEGPIRLAVMPFENMSGDSGQSYFSDGLTEEMIAHLGGLDPGRLAVIARSASARHDPGSNLASLAQELDVDYVMAGSVRQSEGRARITVRLIDLASQSQVWANTYERSLRDILEVQGELARAVAAQVRVAVSPESEARLSESRPVDPEAYRLFLRGRHLYGMGDIASLNRSLRYFERAIERQPDYATAYSGLADSYLLLGEYTVIHQDEVLRRARRAIGKALELDPNSASAHASLGWIQFVYEFDWRAAERSFLRALELNPSNPRARSSYTHLLRADQRIEQAIEQARLALDLDPLSAGFGVNLGFALHDRGDAEAALREFDKVLEMHPSFAPAMLGRGYTLLSLGDVEAAIDAMEEAALAVGGSALFDATLGFTYARAGRPEDARRLLVRMEGAAVRSPFLIALVNVGIGEHGRAFEWLETALRERDPRARFVASDARFAPLRQDPRWQDLTRRLGVSDARPGESGQGPTSDSQPVAKVVPR